MIQTTKMMALSLVFLFYMQAFYYDSPSPKAPGDSMIHTLPLYLYTISLLNIRIILIQKCSLHCMSSTESHLHLYGPHRRQPTELETVGECC